MRSLPLPVVTSSFFSPSMKLIRASVQTLALLGTLTWAASAIAQVTTTPTATTVSTPKLKAKGPVALDDCTRGDDSCDTDPGGGGGGYTPPPGGGPLNWTQAGQAPSILMGGQTDRQGLSATYVANDLTVYVAYKGNSIIDTHNNGYVYVATGLTGPNWYPTQVIPTDTSQSVASGGNPALTYAGNRLWVAYVDGYGDLNYVFSQQSLSTTTNTIFTGWSQPHGCGSGKDGSAAIVSYGDDIYVAARNAADYSLFLCRVSTNGDPTQSILPGDTLSTQSYSSITMGFSPGFGIFNGTLYLGVQNNGSHNIDLYTSPDGSNFTYSSAATNDQTSTTPSFAVHDNALYLGFRSNDGDHKFLNKYTTDGVSWTSGSDPHTGMGGPAALVETSSGYFPIPVLVNIYCANDGSNTIYTMYTTN